jgi:DNA-binding beta-propeller fold protein YncE
LDSVQIEVILERSDGLRIPRDLGFNPDRPGELWVVNRKDDSVVLAFDAGTEQMVVEKRIDPYALHFMDNVSSIDFGAPGTFGTCHESRNTYNDTWPGDDFMGPTLWPSNLDIFAESNPDAVETLTLQFGMPTDLGSHLDMLHNTPLCMGISWQKRNVYWVFDGLNGAIQRVDFHEDHGPGWDDHADGTIRRFVEGKVKMVDDVPSHVEYDHDTDWLYIADSGKGRIAVLDTKTGQVGDDLSSESMEPYPEHVKMKGAELWTFSEHPLLDTPSGLALHDGLLYVSDNVTGRIIAFDLSGQVVDYLETQLPPGALMGITFGPEGGLWFVDAVNNQVVRIQSLKGKGKG